MLRILAGITALLIAAGAYFTLSRSGAHAATTQPTEERFTTYRAPTGPEITASDAEAAAVTYMRRRAPDAQALIVTSVRSSFGRAHALLMGEPEEERVAAESGAGERAEEMRSSVWVTEATSKNGTVVHFNGPVPRGRKVPHGEVLILVADAHTGFTKEEYLGPNGANVPNLGALGTVTQATVPAEAGVTATASSRLNPKLGAIEGRLSNHRAGVRVELRTRHGKTVASETSQRKGAETLAGTFTLRALEGTYWLSAKHCASRKVDVRGRHTIHVTLTCD